ncbi:MAG: ABC transporter substrate-binding protein [Clostridia bacterium]|nr:ABC transporter substrate-binding protein [Clostridia bacterium]
MKKILCGVLVLSIAFTACLGLCGCSKKASNEALVWYTFGDKPAGHDAVMEKVNAIVEPELGMKLDLQYIDSASYAQKMKMKMASGEEYDLLFTGYVYDYQTAASMGGLYDITELLDTIEMKDGTKVKMSDAIEDYYIQTATYNGKVYGIPNAQVISNPQALVMEKPVADECGVDMQGLEDLALQVKIDDVDSLEAYFIKLTDEMGKIKQTRPDLYTMLPFLFGTPGYENMVNGLLLNPETNEIVIQADLPTYQLAVDYVNKWYATGYIREDVASAGASTSSIEEKKQYAVRKDGWKPGMEAIFESQQGVPPVYSMLTEPFVGRTSALLTMTSVGAETKHPEEAVKLIYMLNSNEELFNLLCWGIEGVNYTKNADGTIKEIENSGYNKIGQNAWKFGNQFNSYVLEGQSLDVWEETKNMNDDAEKSVALGFTPYLDEFSSEIANIANVESEYKAKKDFGTVKREEYWNEYRQKLTQAGIEMVRDEIQKQYDEFLKSK